MIDRARLNIAMQRLAEGDRASFDLVFNGVEPVVRRVAVGMLRTSPGDVDDAVQNVMTKLFAQCQAFDPTGDVVRWAMTLSVWECRTLRKRHSRENARRDHVIIEPRDDALSPEDSAAIADMLDSLREVLGHLSSTDSDVLLQVEPASSTERKRRQRATDRLKALWRKYHGQY